MRQEETAMKAMGLKSEGLGTTQKVRGGKSLSAWRGKRFGLRWVRTVLMGRQGRLFAMTIFLPLEKDRLLASEPFSVYDGILAADPPLRNGERPATGSICASLDFAFTWSTTITDTVSGNIGAQIGDRDAAIEANFGAEFSASISVSELIQRGIQVCIQDIPLNPHEWLVPVYVPFGNKELWLCDVYTIYGFVGQVLACNYTRPQAPPYCYLTYFIAPPWVNNISEYMARMARRGICSPGGGGIRPVPIR
jgi:hypothetical protein